MSSMTDLGVRCYGDLARHYTEGVDYAVHVAPRERSGVAILAPHGGRIEGRTSEIARLIAGEDYGFFPVDITAAWMELFPTYDVSGTELHVQRVAGNDVIQRAMALLHQERASKEARSRVA